MTPTIMAQEAAEAPARIREQLAANSSTIAAIVSGLVSAADIATLAGDTDSATLYLENGNEFHIKTLNQSPDHIYVQSVRLNGKTLSGFTLSHADILQGGELEFVMSATPYTGPQEQKL